MDWTEILNNIIYPGILTIISSMIGIMTLTINSYIKSKFKQLNHFKGDSVVQESITQSIDEMGEEIRAALSDGKLTAEEKTAIKNKARAIAEAKLKSLYGFYKSDLTGWINDRIDATLPKFVRSKVKDFVSKNL